MKLIRVIIILFSILLFTNTSIYSNDLVKYKARKGETIISMLKRLHLESDKKNIDLFTSINPEIPKSKKLTANSLYFLPIEKIDFDGKTIRSTLNINDYQLAKKIEKFNSNVVKSGFKKASYIVDKVLWVPQNYLKKKTKTIKEPIEITDLLFGKDLSKVNIKSRKLRNCVFYLISGHGGPDPGAVAVYGKSELHEDEYAYDVILRLGRKLIEYGALVYFVVQDSSDGIREDKILNNSYNEIHLGGTAIPTDQVERLSKRVEIVNSLYETNLSKNIQQYAIEIHVDSRVEKKNIDIFFYHKERDKKGKNFADKIRQTIDKKYAKAQPGRGYEGTLSSRNLYMVRNLKPTTVFIEIGNIQNQRDQKRIMEPNNRQAMANWITDGVLSNFK